MLGAALGDDAGVAGHPAGGAVEPTRDRRLPAARLRLLRQDQERGLAGVLGVLLRAERPAADAEDHAGVSGDQERERRLVAVGESPQQLAVVGR
ncbi:MAG: hypothetical protein U0746_04315 [Gemmataceae bacterium]